MSKLPTEHPEVYEHFKLGFSVQLGSENLFGKIPVDQTTEETEQRLQNTRRDQKIQSKTRSCDQILPDCRTPRCISPQVQGQARPWKV